MLKYYHKVNTGETCRCELNNVILIYSIEQLCGWSKENIVYKQSECYRFGVVFDICGPLCKVPISFNVARQKFLHYTLELYYTCFCTFSRNGNNLLTADSNISPSFVVIRHGPLLQFYGDCYCDVTVSRMQRRVLQGRCWITRSGADRGAVLIEESEVRNIRTPLHFWSFGLSAENP
jgi:hypothetical protein